MEDIFSKAIAAANGNMACLDKQDMVPLRKFITEGNARLNAIKLINEHKDKIVSASISGMIADDPSLTQPGGNCYPSRRMNNATSDMDILLRFLTYALAAGDMSVLEEKCFGLKDLFQTLGVPKEATLRAIAIVQGKTMELLRSDASTEDTDIIKEVSEAFNIIIASVS
ncbi:MAG: hypothetical protein AB4041_04220 [Microcystaceae cyanobacterium]